MGWWITLGIAVFFAALPVGIRIHYDADGPLAKLVLGPVKLTVFPWRFCLWAVASATMQAVLW